MLPVLPARRSFPFSCTLSVNGIKCCLFPCGNTAFIGSDLDGTIFMPATIGLIGERHRFLLPTLEERVLVWLQFYICIVLTVLLLCVLKILTPNFEQNQRKDFLGPSSVQVPILPTSLQLKFSISMFSFCPTVNLFKKNFLHSVYCSLHGTVGAGCLLQSF
jgi:hypothetical protein